MTAVGAESILINAGGVTAIFEQVSKPTNSRIILKSRYSHGNDLRWLLVSSRRSDNHDDRPLITEISIRALFRRRIQDVQCFKQRGHLRNVLAEPFSVHLCNIIAST